MNDVGCGLCDVRAGLKAGPLEAEPRRDPSHGFLVAISKLNRVFAAGTDKEQLPPLPL
jgi:hypothetical protein